MPRIETLVGFHLGVQKGYDLEAKEGNGEQVQIETWTIVLTDQQTRDQIRVGFRKETRDELVRQLTGGVILAGGDLPSV